MGLGDSTELSCYPLCVKPRFVLPDSSLIQIHSDGSVKYELFLSITPYESDMDRFSRKSKQQMPKLLAALLTDVSSRDVDIITSDGATISAHKFILKGMFF